MSEKGVEALEKEILSKLKAKPMTKAELVRAVNTDEWLVLRLMESLLSRDMIALDKNMRWTVTGRSQDRSTKGAGA